MTIIVFFRQSSQIAKNNEQDKNKGFLKRTFLPENRTSRTARNFALLVFLDLFNTISIVLFMNLDAISYSKYNLIANVAFLITVFLYFVVYMNNSSESITFSFRLLGISLVTILVVFSFIGYYTIKKTDKNYNEKNREVIQYLVPD